MYHHCPACTRNLGQNEALEHFPVGKRLAYDVARGRLWALCSRWRSWNLAPIEERWEAVEEAERSFERALVGLSTEHIALGRLPDGTELIRIGGAKAPELAGWRYAQRIQDRYRRAKRYSGLSAAGVVLWSSGAGSLLAPVLPAMMMATGVGIGVWRWRERRGHRLEILPEGPGAAASLHRPAHPGTLDGADPEALSGPEAPAAREAPAGRPRILGRRDLRHLRLLPPDPETEGPGSPDAGWRLLYRRFGGEAVWIPEELRSRALRYAMLELNQEVGKPDQVKKAMDRVVEGGGADAVISAAARSMVEGRAWESEVGWPFGDPRRLGGADTVMRLAIEIAANDEAERVALEGELHRLELEWKEAEEIAAISDDLLLPGWVRSRIAEWRGGRGGASAPRGASSRDHAARRESSQHIGTRHASSRNPSSRRTSSGEGLPEHGAPPSPPPIAPPSGIIDSEGQPISPGPEACGAPGHAPPGSAPERP